MSLWSLITPSLGGFLVLPETHSSTFMVGEAYAHVQDASLKAYAVFPRMTYQLPDHQAGAGSRACIFSAQVISP